MINVKQEDWDVENARDPGAGLDDCALFDKFPSNFMIGMVSILIHNAMERECENGYAAPRHQFLQDTAGGHQKSVTE